MNLSPNQFITNFTVKKSSRKRIADKNVSKFGKDSKKSTLKMKIQNLDITNQNFPNRYSRNRSLQKEASNEIVNTMEMERYRQERIQSFVE